MKILDLTRLIALSPLELTDVEEIDDGAAATSDADEAATGE
jgi:hypothetical protein